MKNLLNKLQNKGALVVLKEKSDNIFNVFTSTAKQLSEVNIQISIEKETRSEQIVLLKDECKVLEDIEKSNQSMINKIESFLKD